MSTFSDKIIDLVSKTPGLTDRELTDRLKGASTHPSQVNQEARLLERKGTLKRIPRHDGKIGNYMAYAGVLVSAPVVKRAPPTVSLRASAENGKPLPKNSVICISCVKSKRSDPCAAKDLYTSTLFRLTYALAEKLQPRRIFILSAKYGLLSPDEVIEPYEKTLKGMRSTERRSWSAGVLAKLQLESNLQEDHYIFFAGLSYREGLIAHIKHYSIPMEGLSFFRQLQWLKKKTT